MKVIGVEIKQGEYNGNKYHNVVFNGVFPAVKDNAVGQLVETVKVSYANILKQFGTETTDRDVYAFVGKNLEFAYDKYGKVNYVTELPDGGYNKTT